MKLFMALSSFFLAMSAHAASTNFDLSCSVIKINDDQYNAPPKIQEDNLFRVQVRDGQGSIQYANAPRIARDTNAKHLIVWKTIVDEGPVSIKNARWSVKVDFDSNRPATVSLTQYTRNNDDPNGMWGGTVRFPKEITLISGETVSSVDFGFCFPVDN